MKSLVDFHVELHRTNELLAEIAAALNRIAPPPADLLPQKTPAGRVVHKNDAYFAQIKREQNHKEGRADG